MVGNEGEGGAGEEGTGKTCVERKLFLFKLLVWSFPIGVYYKLNTNNGVNSRKVKNVCFFTQFMLGADFSHNAF